MTGPMNWSYDACVRHGHPFKSRHNASSPQASRGHLRPSVPVDGTKREQRRHPHPHNVPPAMKKQSKKAETVNDRSSVTSKYDTDTTPPTEQDVLRFFVDGLCKAVQIGAGVQLETGTDPKSAFALKERFVRNDARVVLNVHRFLERHMYASQDRKGAILYKSDTHVYHRVLKRLLRKTMVFHLTMGQARNWIVCGDLPKFVVMSKPELYTLESSVQSKFDRVKHGRLRALRSSSRIIR